MLRDNIQVCDDAVTVIYPFSQFLAATGFLSLRNLVHAFKSKQDKG